jgi:polyhydroxybutyrate depolymerase
VAANPLKKQSEKIKKWVKSNKIAVGVIVVLALWFLFFKEETETVSKTIPDGYASAGRQLYVHAPGGTDDPLPLVLVLHDDSSKATETERDSDASTLADRKNFAVVYPEAVGGLWRVADPRGADAQYLRDVVQYVSQDYKIDSRRVYVWGLGEGGKLALEVACVGTDRVFAAVGVVGQFGSELPPCPADLGVGDVRRADASWNEDATDYLWDESKNYPLEEPKE